MSEGKRTKITLAEVAERAGVGTATVDRVLNDRGNVSEDVSKRVLQAARELGIRRLLPQTHRKMIRIDVILARPELPLIARMGFEFRRLAASIDRSIVIHRTILEDERPETIAKALSRTTCDAVVSYMPDHPLVHEAVDGLFAKNVPVVTVISDIRGSSRIGYAGTDHYKAGRSAGYFLTRMSRAAGPVIILCNHLGFQSHADRVRGIKDFLDNSSEAWDIAEIVEGLDDRDKSELGLRAAFRKYPGAVAIYNVGAANIAVANAIRANLLAARPVFVGHELTQNTAAFLREGLMSIAIDQSPERQVWKAVNLILRHFSYGDGKSPLPLETEVPTVLYGPENIPEPLPF
ncbi:LacI family DNA-binding transcriptional regulator [Rhizobium sp. 21-4511-3d]